MATRGGICLALSLVCAVAGIVLDQTWLAFPFLLMQALGNRYLLQAKVPFRYQGLGNGTVALGIALALMLTHTR